MSQYTVGGLIERFIEEMGIQGWKEGIRPLGPSHYVALRALMGRPIALKDAATLKKQDIFEYAKMRRTTPCKRTGKPVVPATVNQDITYLSGVLSHAQSAWPDCEDISAACIVAARAGLKKYNLIGKSQPRTRRPSDEEVVRLMDLFTAQNAYHRTEINMVPLVAFALASSRRQGEICRITWGDVDFVNAVYWVRDLKHPTRKKGNDKHFILWPELVTILKALPRKDENDPAERIFPYNAKSVSQRFTEACRRLKIVNLRFHDNRREAITQWLKKLGSPHKVRVAVSGHETTLILERVYDGSNAQDMVRDEFSHLLKPELRPT